MTTVILRLLYPPRFDEPETTRIARQLYYVLLSGILTAGSISVITFFFNDSADSSPFANGSAPLVPTIATITLVFLYFLLRLGKIHMIVLCILFIGFIAITSSLLISGYGIRDSSASIFLLLLVLSSVYLGSRATVGFGILSLTIIILVWGAEYLGLIVTEQPQLPLDSLLTLITGISFSTIFLQATVNRMVESSAKIREQAAELESNNRDLREAQQVLRIQTAELSRLNDELKREMAEREITESALRQRQKLDSIGVLAGGVAHDFNNLLTGMIAQSSLAFRKVGEEHSASANIAKAIDSAKRGVDLTRQLLAYAGKSKFLTEPLSLNECIHESKGLFETLIQHSEVLDYSLTESLPYIVADRGQIQQVLMNLIMNASQAIEHERGLIHICTESVQLGLNADINVTIAPFIGSNPPPGDYVMLSVGDNGQGMDGVTQEKIFDPYFTTKDTGHGLGLSAIAGIVRSLHGGVRVSSQLGKGTTFSIYLPATVKRPLNEPKLPLRKVPKSNHGTVLVIDDEATIVDSTVEILQEAGYATFSARNGEEGLAVFEQHYREIDVVLLDIHMPGVNGIQTFSKMQKMAPDVSVILSSGYATIKPPPDFFSVQARGFLPKPYSIDNLLEQINNTIQSKQSSVDVLDSSFYSPDVSNAYRQVK